MQSVNRAVAVIKPKQPFVDWLNSMPDDSMNYTVERLSKDNTVFLIPEYDDPEDFNRYIKKNFRKIFEWELWGWITAEEFWPKKRDWKMFNEWLEIEINSVVVDLVEDELEREDL